MESLKKFGVVFSTHYEKIILSVILLALLAAAGFLCGGSQPLSCAVRSCIAERISRAVEWIKRNYHLG